MSLLAGSLFKSPQTGLGTFSVFISWHVCVCAQSLCCVRLFAAPHTVACQAPLSMKFSRQKYWSGLPFHTPGDLPNPGIEPSSLTSPALADILPSDPPGKPQETGKVIWYSHLFKNLPQFVVIHSQRLSHSETGDVFLEFPCFLHDPTNAGNLISSSSASLKLSLYI